MRTVKYSLLTVLTLSLVGLAFAEEKAKYTIKEVMKMAHAGGKKSLLTKVSSGTADKADKEKLAELYAALAANKPPQGEAKSWDEKTKALIKASKDVLAGKEGSDAELKKAANCMACHGLHRPK